MTYKERILLMEANSDLSLRRQAVLLDVPRSSFYYQPVINSDSELAHLISEIYLASNCRYGYRKITEALNQNGDVITNKKKVLKVMQEMGIEGLYPKRYIHTSMSNDDLKYPYLLTGLEIIRPNQVWATDITYVKLYDKFMYVIAVIDLFSRYIVGYDISHNLEANFCIALVKSLFSTVTPEIFNTDRGVQFTCHNFIDELNKNNVQVSMDGKGHCFDNIFMERFWRTLKQEAIYFFRPETIRDLEQVIADFVPWYNNTRLHQSLNYKTPALVYNVY